jgi:hypothetical protein
MWGVCNAHDDLAAVAEHMRRLRENAEAEMRSLE